MYIEFDDFKGLFTKAYLILTPAFEVLSLLLKTQRTNVTWESQDLNISLLDCTAPTAQMLEVASHGPPDFSRAQTDSHAPVSYICVLVVFLCSVFSKTKESAQTGTATIPKCG